MTLDEVKLHLMKEYNEAAAQVHAIDEHARKFQITKEALSRDISYVSLTTRRDTLRDALAYIVKNS